LVFRDKDLNIDINILSNGRDNVRVIRI